MNLNATTLLDQTSVANRAMKFYLHRGAVTLRVRDKIAEQDIKARQGDQGQIVTKDQFKEDPNCLVRQYQRKNSEMYSYHYRMTLPFGDDGARLLSNHAYFDYTTQMGEMISRLEQLKAQIVSQWDALVAEDVTLRNARLIKQGYQPTVTADEYPTVEQIEARLYVKWYAAPIATSADFRFEVPDEMKLLLDKQLEDYVEEASKERFGRILEPVTAFIDKLDKYTGEKGQQWRHSFVDNLNGLSEEIAPLNFDNDPTVKAFVDQIKSIVTPFAMAPSALKESPEARALLKEKLQAVQTSLRGHV